MTTIHADSQVSTAEAADLLLAALASPEHRHTYELAGGRKLGSQEMLARYKVATPDGGELHRVALIDVTDGEPMGFDVGYRDESDAVAVWEHIVATLTPAAAPPG
ncbi:hypothetical protein [Nocardioides pinisoli]|uniref:Uncharacterized protein n=1 Tax=Nocardioides pinisoli TaxID=2950279 RepID=A0ABT1KRG5_9ACTN|nr:hypothetical protein [Nocardioides pinisoli]MCP3420333.1 hypothetical protein [Nocardioides pinisoli]